MTQETIGEQVPSLYHGNNRLADAGTGVCGRTGHNRRALRQRTDTPTFPQGTNEYCRSWKLWQAAQKSHLLSATSIRNHPQALRSTGQVRDEWGLWGVGVSHSPVPWLPPTPSGS